VNQNPSPVALRPVQQHIVVEGIEISINVPDRDLSLHDAPLYKKGDRINLTEDKRND
jgi:hypothetical protein